MYLTMETICGLKANKNCTNILTGPIKMLRINSFKDGNQQKRRFLTPYCLKAAKLVLLTFSKSTTNRLKLNGCRPLCLCHSLNLIAK